MQILFLAHENTEWLQPKWKSLILSHTGCLMHMPSHANAISCKCCRMHMHAAACMDCVMHIQARAPTDSGPHHLMHMLSICRCAALDPSCSYQVEPIPPCSQADAHIWTLTHSALCPARSAAACCFPTLTCHQAQLLCEPLVMHAAAPLSLCPHPGLHQGARRRPGL